MEHWTQQEAHLRSRREELVQRLATYEHELGKPANPDAEDRAVERENDEVLEDLGFAGVKEIAAIDRALERIRTGQYGICQSCGDQIALERLEAIPWASLCRSCA